MKNNKYVRPNTRTEMYAGRVAFYPLVSHIEYAPCALYEGIKRRDRQSDRRTDSRPLRFAYAIDAASVMNAYYTCALHNCL